MKIRFFETNRGQAPVREYIDSLPTRDVAKIGAALSDIAEHGLRDALTQLRQIRGTLWEIKIQPHRIFYAVVEGDTLVLLHAYRKQSQRAPKNEIATALGRLKVLTE
ncbi:MAG TPA: type II toxin-antitoxin system RelE/ParE family toxin [Nannocystis sp.]|jgi:phage-related protein